MSSATIREPVEARRMGVRVPLRRALAALLLPLSLVPVVLLAPSLFRAPAILVRHAAHALAPAHQRAVHHAPEGPRYYLVGPARLEIEAFEGAAGAMTPKVGVSPLDEPEWAARAAAADAGIAAPSVLLARGRELTTASGRPLRTSGRPLRTRPAVQSLHRATSGQPRRTRLAARPAHRATSGGPRRTRLAAQSLHRATSGRPLPPTASVRSRPTTASGRSRR